jgi:hypothetical protein
LVAVARAVARIRAQGENGNWLERGRVWGSWDRLQGGKNVREDSGIYEIAMQ